MQRKKTHSDEISVITSLEGSYEDSNLEPDVRPDSSLSNALLFHRQGEPSSMKSSVLCALYGSECLSIDLVSAFAGSDESVAAKFLHAAQTGNEKNVRQLIDLGNAAAFAYDAEDGRTVLSWAAGQGNEWILTTSPNRSSFSATLEIDKQGRTALSWAAEEGKTQVVKLLLQYPEVDIDVRDTAWWTPLWWAAAGNHVDVVRILLERGANVCSRNFSGRQLLCAVARKGSKGLVTLLLKHGAEIDDQYPPLLEAARGGNLPIVKLLFRAGADPDDRGSEMYPPSLLVIQNGHEAVVKLQITPRNRTNDPERQQTEARGHQSIIKLLLETGKIDINEKVAGGRTALHIAAEHGDEALVKLLLDTGKAKVNAKTHTSQTPLHLAAGEGGVGVVKQLLDTGEVNLDIRDDVYRDQGEPHMTALELAQSAKRTDVVKVLREFSKNVKALKPRKPFRRW
ncbi:MAG: hypothetical protein M1820_008929 [Bogoriella megaspora]|nr:MAG: hypothetical protein M1820_008929 [Bogoriella megaspora]